LGKNVVLLAEALIGGALATGEGGGGDTLFCLRLEKKEVRKNDLRFEAEGAEVGLVVVDGVGGTDGGGEGAGDALEVGAEASLDTGAGAGGPGRASPTTNWLRMFGVRIAASTLVGTGDEVAVLVDEDAPEATSPPEGEREGETDGESC
jgi:hypothetical protein